MRLKQVPPELRFPAGFRWGASTAAYRIEGGGRGSDMWDWERRRGWERSGACADSWNRWKEDIRCLRELGADTYRFSVEWGRLFPEPGRLDEAAARRYEQMVQTLHGVGIRPIVCLHHFTHPAWFWTEHPQGWADPKAPERFAEFARAVRDCFGPRVRDWLTFNEPNMMLLHSRVTGRFPPGRRAWLDLNPPDLREAIQGVVRAHHLAARLLRVGGESRVGIAQNIAHLEPLTPSRGDRQAALLWDQCFHWNLLDGAAGRPMDLDLDGEAEAAPPGGDALDFVGINYAARVIVRRAGFLRGELKALAMYPEFAYGRRGFGLLLRMLGAWRGDHPHDDMGREIYPEGIEPVVRTAHRRYKKPILITENGLPDAEGRMREVHLIGHLMRLLRAMEEADVEGYLYGSLIDGYEWGSFKPRFGLFSVDRARGFERRITPGGELYREIIRASKEAASP